jgi:hypothetical protein
MWSGILKDKICRKIKWSSHRTNFYCIDIKVLVWGLVSGSSHPKYLLITGLCKTAVNLRNLQRFILYLLDDLLLSFSLCFVINFPTKPSLYMILYKFIYHLYYDMFQPVIEAIIGCCCKCMKGKK